MEIPRVDPLENPVELTGVSPPENEVDDNILPPLFPSDYVRDDESDEEDEDTDTSIQQHQRVIQPEAMSSKVRNVHNIRPRKKTKYAN